MRFKLRLLPAPFFNETKQFGDYLRQALATVGIDAEIVSERHAGPSSRRSIPITPSTSPWRPPVYRGDPAISTTILFQSGLPAGVPFSNQYGYANPAVDDLIKQAAAELDEAKRADLYKEFQKAVVGDVALINVAEFSFITVASDKVQNVSNNPRWAVSNWADTWVQA